MTDNSAPKKATQILDPNPARRKKLVEKLQMYFNDKISLSELKGIPREKLFLLAETGQVKLKHGRLEEAEEIFKCLLLLDHRNAYVHSAMASVHQRQNRPVEAIFEYTQALTLNQKDCASFVNRGEIYLRHKNYKKAAEDFRNAILIDMSGRNLWANRARSLVIALKRSMDADRAKPPAPRRTVAMA